MSIVADIGTACSLWIDAVAGVVRAGLERFESSRRIEIAEEEDGSFVVRASEDMTNTELAPSRLHIVEGVVQGLDVNWTAAFRDSRVVVTLRPARFLFRPLDLPKRAGEFLEGIVRAQIDRLTPWSATEAVYHWTTPHEAGERIVMTIAASARSLVVPVVQAIADLGAVAVEVSTVTPAPEESAVIVYLQEARAAAGAKRIRNVLLWTLLGSGISAVAALGVSGFLATSYDDDLAQVQRRIAERRAVIRAGQNGAGGSALALLERRKQTSSSSVIVIEALSALLPDHTYATEIEMDGDKVQITGFTHNAPSLIPLLEQSPHFTHATFFAPTTRGPNDPGERFHIEARIRPYFKPGT